MCFYYYSQAYKINLLPQEQAKFLLQCMSSLSAFSVFLKPSKNTHTKNRSQTVKEKIGSQIVIYLKHYRTTDILVYSLAGFNNAGI